MTTPEVTDTNGDPWKNGKFMSIQGRYEESQGCLSDQNERECSKTARDTSQRVQSHLEEPC
jgi:hypothetical protein